MLHSYPLKEVLMITLFLEWARYEVELPFCCHLFYATDQIQHWMVNLWSARGLIENNEKRTIFRFCWFESIYVRYSFFVDREFWDAFILNLRFTIICVIMIITAYLQEKITLAWIFFRDLTILYVFDLIAEVFFF